MSRGPTAEAEGRSEGDEDEEEAAAATAAAWCAFGAAVGVPSAARRSEWLRDSVGLRKQR